MMIVVAIVGILAAVAIPSYRQHVEKGRIAAATGLLAESKVRMEQIFNSNRSYEIEPNKCLDLTATFADSKFTPTVTCSASGFTISISGTAGGPMVGFSYSINQAGEKFSTTPDSGGEKACWLRARGTNAC
ncbi:type IV pilin protein [Niveibacterium sp. 24ML]|uniref:type IV pilin protein n=1 Tax=Niveibacterium sp. 24ML TaxID=2985512 RepID=UPI002B4BD792|nr:type IV pilin protein [Niveibacterium sp. 24ML]